MSHRSFDPRRDEAAVRRWLRPGERLVWTRHSFAIHYDMPGRRRDGKKRSLWRILGWILLIPVIFVLLDGTGDTGSGDSAPRSRRPLVVAFGGRRGCQAGPLADAGHRKTGFWVLTSHRFAYLEPVPLQGNRGSAQSRAKRFTKDARQIFTGAVDKPPPEAVRLETVWEFGPGQFSHQGTVTRKRGQYERIGLSDGSGFDFRC